MKRAQDAERDFWLAWLFLMGLFFVGIIAYAWWKAVQ